MGKPTDVGAVLKASRERQNRENETSWGATPQSEWFPQSGRSPDFFPPDVRVWVDQDIPNTDPMLGMQDPMLGQARQLLHRALLMKEKGVTLPVRLSRQISDDIWVGVLLTGDQKIVRITTQNPFIPKKSEVPVEPAVISDGQGFIYMLCGETKDAATVTVDEVELLRDFAPTPATSSSHSVPLPFTDNEKLGACAADLVRKGSSFSGTMKRVVQAVQGMGKIDDASPPYIQTDPPQEARRSVHLLYTSSGVVTHGIYKAGPQNHWLIEIGYQRGILAMPLPIIGSTMDPGYLRHLEKIGDTGGAAVVREFGGLPSGETFPTGDDLTTAITEKKVLRLLLGSQLPFYTADVGQTNSFPYSWAFSESGIAAHTVRFVYQRDPDEPTDTRFFMFAEHWAINLDLSLHKITRPEDEPVGVGSASMDRLSRGKIPLSAVRGIWSNGGPLLANFIGKNIPEPYPNWNDTFKPENIGLEPPGWGAVVHAFFIGEQPIAVKWVPEVCIGLRKETIIVEVDYYPPALIAYAPLYQTKSVWGYSFSPAAFVTDFYDPRVLNAAVRDVEFGYEYQQLYALQSYVDANPNSFNYNYGVVNPSEFVLVGSWCLVPANCREGVAIAKVIGAVSGTGSGPILSFANDAQGLFNGVGHISIYADGTMRHAPDPRAESCMFDAVVNAGPSTAYVMTRVVKTDASPQEYTRVNLRPGADAVRINNTTFIGSY